MGKARVVAVRKDKQGDIVRYKLNDGRVMDFDGMRQLIHNDEVENLMCVPGRPYEGSGDQPLVIRSFPDGDITNNLDNLPLF